LSDGYRLHQQLDPERYQAGREQGLTTLRQFDERITAHYGGFRDASDYYARSSAGPHLAAITHPTLLLVSADDPMIPVDSVARWPRSQAVRLEVLATGGHVGFVAPTAAPGSFWAAERALGFLERWRGPSASRPAEGSQGRTDESAHPL
jgi:predicted alpha/beta-fold hydrolase